jgi:glycosyltransferase involved in cell wall biosynthesis
MKKIIVSALVLAGSRSGYRRILKNLVEYCLTGESKFKWVFIFQKSGWDTLELDCNKFPPNIQIRVIDDFFGKWSRGLLEQFYIPLFALWYRSDIIFMPSTFGLFFPVKPTLTFVHTNTNFKVDPSMRGRGRLQQMAHSVLIRVTAATSRKLLFTSEITYREYCEYLNTNFPPFILGNGLIPPNINLQLANKFSGIKKNKFLLSVSQIYRLKNFDSLIKAFIRMKNQNDIPQDFKLIIVGTVQESNYFQELCSLVGGRKDIIFFHNISDVELSGLYVNCFAYCFYSYFEGYSLTPGEALLANVPISISNISTHREIYEGLPYYADPKNITSIMESIRDIFNAPKTNKIEEINKIKEKLSFEKFIQRLEMEFVNV